MMHVEHDPTDNEAIHSPSHLHVTNATNVSIFPCTNDDICNSHVVHKCDEANGTLIGEMQPQKPDLPWVGVTEINRIRAAHAALSSKSSCHKNKPDPTKTWLAVSAALTALDAEKLGKMHHDTIKTNAHGHKHHV
jgi:hypothetical protein